MRTLWMILLLSLAGSAGVAADESSQRQAPEPARQAARRPLGDRPCECDSVVTKDKGAYSIECKQNEKKCPDLFDGEEKVTPECRYVYLMQSYSKEMGEGNFACVCIYKPSKGTCHRKEPPPEAEGRVSPGEWCDGKCPDLKDAAKEVYTGRCIEMRFIEGKDKVTNDCACVYAPPKKK
jgi:hypothetical protein